MILRARVVVFVTMLPVLGPVACGSDDGNGESPASASGSTGATGSSAPSGSMNSSEAQDATSRDAVTASKPSSSKPDGAGQAADALLEADGPSVPAPNAGLPSVEPSLKLHQLTLEQKGQICDWWAASFGGYGVLNECVSGYVPTDENQAACLTARHFEKACNPTVAQLERCVVARTPSKGCDRPFEECRAYDCY